MSDGRRIVPNQDAGFFQGVARHFKLVWALFNDARVPWLTKLIPFGSFLYFIFPFDIPTPIDDVGVIVLASYMFIELCPPDVVEEHRQELESTISAEVRDPEEIEIADEDIIDAEFKQE
jgi:uncharacterized membrane protein YkvA (DUF1232 family)